LYLILIISEDLRESASHTIVTKLSSKVIALFSDYLLRELRALRGVYWRLPHTIRERPIFCRPPLFEDTEQSRRELWLSCNGSLRHIRQAQRFKKPWNSFRRC